MAKIKPVTKKRVQTKRKISERSATPPTNLPDKPSEKSPKYSPVPSKNAEFIVSHHSQIGVLFSRSLEKNDADKLLQSINFSQKKFKAYINATDIINKKVQVYVIPDALQSPNYNVSGKVVMAAALGVPVVKLSRFKDLKKDFMSKRVSSKGINLYDYLPTGEGFRDMCEAIKDNFINPPFKRMNCLYWAEPEDLENEKLMNQVNLISKNFRDLYEVCGGKFIDFREYEKIVRPVIPDKNAEINIVTVKPPVFDYIVCPFASCQNSEKYGIDDHPLKTLPTNLAQLTVYDCTFSKNLIENGITKFITDTVYDKSWRWLARPSFADFRINPYDSEATSIRSSSRLETKNTPFQIIKTPKINQSQNKVPKTPTHPNKKSKQSDTPDARRPTANPRTPNVATLSLSESFNMNNSPESENLISSKNTGGHISKYNCNGADWFEESSLNHTREIIVKERLFMILNKFRPANSKQIPKDCVVKQTPSNMYSIEQFDIEYVICLSLVGKEEKSKFDLFYQACELVGWKKVHEKIRLCYINNVLNTKQSGVAFEQFCARCLKTSAGRMIMSHFTDDLKKDYFECANLTGKNLRSPKYYQTRVLDLPNAEHHWTQGNFNHRISIFWSTDPPEDCYNSLIMYLQQVAENLLNNDIDLSKFVSRLFYETLNFTTSKIGNDFFLKLFDHDELFDCKLSLPQSGQIRSFSGILNLYKSMMNYPDVFVTDDPVHELHEYQPSTVEFLLKDKPPTNRELMTKSKSSEKTPLHSLFEAISKNEKLRSNKIIEETKKLITYYIKIAPASLFSKDKQYKTPIEYVKFGKIGWELANFLYGVIPEDLRKALEELTPEVFKGYTKLQEKEESTNGLKLLDINEGLKCARFQFDPLVRRLVSSYVLNFYSLTSQQKASLDVQCPGFFDQVFLA
jgi:hypothetical protein